MSISILMIEDNAQNRYLTHYLLAQRDHIILEASTGPEGLALAAKKQPDLILLDIQLPGMNGYAVARPSSWTRPQSIPIVAVTSYALARDRERCLEAGAEGYIEKPIDPDNFVELVERFLPTSNSQEY